MIVLSELLFVKGPTVTRYLPWLEFFRRRNSQCRRLRRYFCRRLLRRNSGCRRLCHYFCRRLCRYSCRRLLCRNSG